MATQRLKLTNTEHRQHHASLVRLKQLGIPIGSDDDPSPEPDRLVLAQLPHEPARLYEFLSDEVGVVVPVRMTVLTSGMLITDPEIRTGLYDRPLDFSDSTWDRYQEVIDTLCFPLPVLNRRLTSGVPLRRCQVEGVIIANGWSEVPPQWHDETPVKVELFLRDERRTEICSQFAVRLDRSLKRKYEWFQARQRENMRLKKQSGGLFAPKEESLEDQKKVGRKETFRPQHADGDDDSK